MLEPRGALHSTLLLRHNNNNNRRNESAVDTVSSSRSENAAAAAVLGSSSSSSSSLPESGGSSSFCRRPDQQHPTVAAQAVATTTVKQQLQQPRQQQQHYYEHHDTPAVPMHPALEYETTVVAVVEATVTTTTVVLESSSSPVGCSICRWRRKWAKRLLLQMSKKEFDLKLLVAFLFLVASGVGTIVSAKLQAIPMYNYPNFLNLFSTLLYIPICFAYIVPASRFGTTTTTTTNVSNAPVTSAATTAASSSSSSLWPQRRLLKRFAIIGALDSLAMTLQTFAAVYLPGPLLILLPQAAIPVSLALTAFSGTAASSSSSYNNRQGGGSGGVTLTQWAGAATVLFGIYIVLEPVFSAQHAPDFYCEAADRENDCTVCQVAVTETDCLAASAASNYAPRFSSSIKNYSGDALFTQLATTTTTSAARWLSEQQQEFEPPPNACRWLPFGESSQEKEFLEIVWSVLLMASTVPMALSAIYKQRFMRSVSTTSPVRPESMTGIGASTHQLPPAPALYVSGWIAVFQFLWSLAIALPAGMMASPKVQPWHMPENLFNGMLCYAGKGVIETGCHPDTLCATQHAAIWVNVTVLCHAAYTISMMLVLQGSSSSVLLFLALTVTVPLGNLVFAMPFMPHPSQAVMRTADLAGLIVILAGLVLYRFSDSGVSTAPGNHSDDDDDKRDFAEDPWRIHYGAVEESDDKNEESLTSLLRSLWPVDNQTSYTLLREPILSGDV